MNYYYLAASLPSLALEGPLPLSFERFRALCAEHLSREDLEALDELDRPVTDSSRRCLVRAWREGEIRVRNAVARARAARLRVDAAPALREQQGVDLGAEKAVAEAFAKRSPAERELALDRFRWQRIEELAGYNAFSGRALLAYGLKLRLAERWAGMKEEAGRRKAEAVLATEPVETA
jgi:hypothetical protein